MRVRRDRGGGGAGKKLAWTVRLLELYPQVSERSCDYCERYAHEDGPGGVFGKVIRLASGDPMPRPRGVPTPCHQCPKVPAGGGGRADAIDPTPASRQAVYHYRRCRAVNRFPDDELFEFNAGIIFDLTERCAQARAARDQEATLLLVLGSRR